MDQRWSRLIYWGGGGGRRRVLQKKFRLYLRFQGLVSLNL